MSEYQSYEFQAIDQAAIDRLQNPGLLIIG